MTTRASGTGLGLAIVKKIIEEHFGEMKFSDAPGGGTRVTIRFNPSKLARLSHDDAISAPSDSDDSAEQMAAMDK